MYNMPKFVVDGCNLKRAGCSKMTAYDLNQLAYKTLVEYITSADDEILESHIPDFYGDYYGRIPRCLKENVDELVF